MRLTYYYPWGFFHPVRSGAAAVAMQHMEYFRSRGFQVRVALWADDNAVERRAFESRFSWLDDLCVMNLRRYPDIQRFFQAYTFADYLKGYVAICDLPEFQAFMSAPADVVFCNYIFTAPFLDFVPRTAIRVLESVDIMSKQFLLGHDAPIRLRHDLRVECELYKLYDLVLMLNQEEATVMQAGSSARIEYLPRGMELPPPKAPLEAADSAYDLLFVGCPHPPNIEGVHWFYNHVFRSHLKQHGLRWAIAGSIGEHLGLSDPDVRVLGRVDDLDAVYFQSKIAVVPLFKGAGISIKTLEALSRGKPVVSTPIGARGLPDCGDSLIKIDFERAPEEVARTILELHRSAKLRNAYAQRARSYIEARFSREIYSRRLDDLLLPLLDRSKKLCA